MGSLGGSFLPILQCLNRLLSNLWLYLRKYSGTCLHAILSIAKVPRPQQRVKLTFGARSLAFWVASKEEACELFDEAYSQQRCAKLRFRAVGTVGR